MAIPSIPTNFAVQTANGQILVTWDLTAGATSYTVQRSTDAVTYTTVSSPTATKYLDTAVTLGTQYYYQVASTNTDGTSSYTVAQSAVPTTTGEMCLSQIRLAAKQRADRVNSQFVTDTEWNSYINQSMFELYDLLVDQYEDYFMAPMASFTTTGNVFLYPLPDGITAFTDNNGNALVATPFYKLLGVDLALNTANNAYVTMDRFNFVDRNKYLYANSSSTIYGVYNMQYRLMGNQIEFIPTPTAGQKIRLAYIPRLTQLLQDTDITTIGFSGWLEYVIVKAAYLALTKEESDTTAFAQQINALTKRIEDSAMNRDAGRPDTISDVRRGNGFGGGPFNGGTGGAW